jgi:hypothetical protein
MTTREKLTKVATGSRVFVPMEKSVATVGKSFTSSAGEVGYELKFSDGDEGSYLASEVCQVMKREGGI